MSLTLYVDGGSTKDFQTSVSDLKSVATFSRAVVKDGTWIFYKYNDFNDKPDNQAKWVELRTPSEQEVDISNFNGSVYLLPQETEGIVLFEHSNYGGKRMYYNNYCDDLNPDFPHRKVGGVSAAIVLGGMFEVFTNRNRQGVSSILTDGRYPTPPAMNFGSDAMQSIRKL